MWRWITGEPTRAFPDARHAFYRVARSERFASLFGFSRVGTDSRAEYAAFLKMLKKAEFRQSNFLQGGWAGRGANGKIVLALSRGNLRNALAAQHELTHLLRHFLRITPFEAEASMRGIFRYRAWIEEVIVWIRMWRGFPPRW